MNAKNKASLYQYGTGLIISVYLTSTRFPVPFYRSYSVRVPVITTRELKPRRTFNPLTLPVYTTSKVRRYPQCDIIQERSYHSTNYETISCYK